MTSVLSYANGEWHKQAKEIEDGIKKSRKQADNGLKKRLEWLRSLIPSVEIGNTTVIEGWGGRK